MKKRAIFRADGNGTIGAGHIMRCLSIADCAVSKGIDCLFATAGNEFEKSIETRGYRVVSFGTDYSDMASEMDLFQTIISDYKPNIIFIDSYYVTESYLIQLQEFGRKTDTRTIYLDDVAKFAYPCDILINYNIYGPDMKQVYTDLYRKKGMSLPDMLLGANYAPLRAEFRGLSDRSVGKAEKILVSTGGADAEHLTLELIKAAGECAASLEFHFVIGPMNEDRDKIHEIAAEYSTIILHENVRDMSRMMRSVDVAISAAGSTLYELCATQTPTITYILADNQIPGAEGFLKRGVMECVGDVRESSTAALAERLIRSVAALTVDYKRRVDMVDRMKGIVDGNGGDRMLRAICKSINI